MQYARLGNTGLITNFRFRFLNCFSLCVLCGENPNLHHTQLKNYLSRFASSLS